MLLETLAENILKDTEMHCDYGPTNFGINQRALIKYRKFALSTIEGLTKNFIDPIVNFAKKLKSLVESTPPQINLSIQDERNIFLQELKFAQIPEPYLNSARDYLFENISTEEFIQKAHDEYSKQPKLAPWTTKEVIGLKAVFAQLKAQQEMNVLTYFKEGEANLENISTSAIQASQYGSANCAGMAHLAYCLAFTHLEQPALIQLWCFEDKKYRINEDLNFISVSIGEQHVVVIPWLNKYFLVNNKKQYGAAEVQALFVDKYSRAYKKMSLTMILETRISGTPEDIMSSSKKQNQFWKDYLMNESRKQNHEAVEKAYQTFINEYGTPQLREQPYGPYLPRGIFYSPCLFSNERQKTQVDQFSHTSHPMPRPGG